LFLKLYLYGILKTPWQTRSYKKEFRNNRNDALFSYYGQNGSNAAVQVGDGSEELTDVTSSLIVRFADEWRMIFLTLDICISAYFFCLLRVMLTLTLDGKKPREIV